jgi:type I restriction enzyme M protein
LNGINVKTAPKKFIHELSEDLLLKYADKPLMNHYNIFQNLMNYWSETMKDDLYILIEDGWKANTKRILEKNKSGKEVDKGWTCDLIPKNLVIQRYLADEAKKLSNLEAELETTQAEMTSLEEEHSAEEAAFFELDKINKANVKQLIKELNNTPQTAMAAEPNEKYGADEHEPLEIAEQWLSQYEKNSTLKKTIKAQEKKLGQKTLEQFGKLNETDVRQLVIEDKWLFQLQDNTQLEIDAISQRLTSRIKELAGRYESKLGTLATETENLEAKVSTHLEKMGLVWN